MSEKGKYFIGVLIGRFEPFHNGHHSLVKFALENVYELVIVLGSCNVARSIKNPWTGEEREEMIRACFDEETNERLKFVHASDYLYNDNRWLTSLQNQLAELNGEDDYILFGEEKDRSSFYLRMFPQWKHLHAGDNFIHGLDATKIREAYFQGDHHYVGNNVPAAVFKCLFGTSEVIHPKVYQNLCDEYKFFTDYKAKWELAPYKPTFVTVDAVVIQSGHVLCVRRKGYPGRGLIALPGGFLNQEERVRDAAIRELREETKINMTREALDKCIVDEHVFDHPDRSTRGRTITHAFCLNLGNGKLPRVKGSDDAEKAFWMPLSHVSLREAEFYEDHASIISYFSMRF
jgi:bifunctional NMN adenylyltransferase/nudix hydrolase